MKMSESWDSGVLVDYICCTFDLTVFKVILSQSVRLSESGCNSKSPGRRAIKVGSRGYL